MNPPDTREKTVDICIGKQIRGELAPLGKLRAAINMSNVLLVNGKSADGKPDGVSPKMARAIANELNIELELIPYEGPGQIADAATKNEWDIANIAAEPERAKTIDFSPAYCEIQATYLKPNGSPLHDLAQVDQPGVKISVRARSAYDLWLTENLKHASLIRFQSHEETFQRFTSDNLDVLAGLRPMLLEYQEQLPGSEIFSNSFTAVKQSIGCQAGKPVAARFLRDFVFRARQSGLVTALMAKYGVSGKLSVIS